jgi:hypothetical protein
LLALVVVLLLAAVCRAYERPGTEYTPSSRTAERRAREGAEYSAAGSFIGPAQTGAQTPPVQTVTVRFDAAGPEDPARSLAASNRQIPTTLIPWERWAFTAPNSPAPVSILPSATPERAVWLVGVTDRATRAGLEIQNVANSPLTVRVEACLPRGLWRTDAALLSGVIEPVAGRPGERAFTRELSGTPVLWRMESVLRPSAGTTVKSVRLLPGQVMFLRWTETVTQAAQARQRARAACAQSDNGIMQERVSAVLENIGRTLDALPTLVGRGDRTKIVRRTHAALLATGKAQAVWQNWREPAAEDQDAAFGDLTAALSEVSLAACNLVPSQSVVASGDGGTAAARVRVSLTNAGTRTIPLVSLGLARRTDGTLSSDRTVFRSLTPGRNVTATFTVPGGGSPDDAPALIQFISDNGAAVVPARPAPPGDTGP